jgi:hypothetical protein
MLSAEGIRELGSNWLPNLTDAGLERLLDLLRKGSPLLIRGCFTKAIPMGCLATHAAWNHPQTEHLNLEAGITWLHKVARLNPATSYVIRDWDAQGDHDWELRSQLVAILEQERQSRHDRTAGAPAPSAVLMSV